MKNKYPKSFIGNYTKSKRLYILICKISLSYVIQDDDKNAAIQAFTDDTVTGKPLLLNIESRIAGVPVITLVDPTSKEDIVKALVADGYLICTYGKDRKLKDLVKSSVLNA
jgi:hypothetical protein